jgi:hypothetical protein
MNHATNVVQGHVRARFVCLEEVNKIINSHDFPGLPKREVLVPLVELCADLIVDDGASNCIDQGPKTLELLRKSINTPAFTRSISVRSADSRIKTPPMSEELLSDSLWECIGILLPNKVPWDFLEVGLAITQQ